MMDICRDINLWKNVKNPVVTIGSFDGVHCAHKAIINLLNKYADEEDGESVLISFSPHPRLVLNTNDEYKKEFRLITMAEEKEKLLAKAGLKNLLIIHFDQNFADLSAQDFIKNIIVDKIHAKRVVIGYNHNFGHDREGGFEQMKKWGDKYGFSVNQYPQYTHNNKNVSSSIVRKLIKEGLLSEANEILGYNYFISGLWHQDIFDPISKFKIIPAKGNYLAKVLVNKRYYYCICIVDEEIRLPDLYSLQQGDKLKIRFLKKIEI